MRAGSTETENHRTGRIRGRNGDPAKDNYPDQAHGAAVTMHKRAWRARLWSCRQAMSELTEQQLHRPRAAHPIAAAQQSIRRRATLQGVWYLDDALLDPLSKHAGAVWVTSMRNLNGVACRIRSRTSDWPGRRTVNGHGACRVPVMNRWTALGQASAQSGLEIHPLHE
jgi:hypothetical protein